MRAEAGPVAGAVTNAQVHPAVFEARERFGNLAVRRGSALPEARGAQESSENMSEQAPGRRRIRTATTPRLSPPGRR